MYYTSLHKLIQDLAQRRRLYKIFFTSKTMGAKGKKLHTMSEKWKYIWSHEEKQQALFVHF
jgi:hypothetical protein